MTAPESASAALTITLFGPMHVLVQGHPLPPMRSRKGLWLLALLTLRHDRPVEREWLSGTLWPDVDQSQAFDNLRPILSELRGRLGDQSARLQAPNRRTLLLDLAGADVDILRFDAAIERGRLSDLEQAVRLYRGPLLEGCNEEWGFQERAAREQECLLALQKLGDTALSGGDYEQAIRHYQRAVGIDPWGEAARRGWMEALAKHGDTNAALQVYRDFVAVLKSDPRAVPDEKTSALYQRLRSEARQRVGTHAVVAAGAGATPGVQGYLPYSLTDLVGREDERIEVALLLKRSRLVTLTGVGGIGKTRLAREVAGELVREYADGVWLVALEALSEGRLLAQQIASVLGLKEETGRPLLQSLTEHLRPKRMLLVLDNCEHLLEASAQVVAHLLLECREVRILATSREALGITGESVWSVPALAVPDPEHLPQGQATLLRVLMNYEGVQLFVERAQTWQKTFALTGSNARMVARICARLEGIPFALELAAARIRALTVDQIAALLHNELRFLTGGSRHAPPRQQTLRAMLDWSYALLQEPEQRLLQRLSVFVGGWRREAAEAVCAGEGIPSSQVLNLLQSLIDKSLVVFGKPKEAEEHYHLLEMVRQFAAEHLHASGEREERKFRHLEWCLTFAEQAESALSAGEQAVWLPRLEREHGNLRAALGWRLQTGKAGERKEQEARSYAPIPLRLCGALLRFWHTRGHLAEGRAWCESALQTDGAQERTAVRAKVLNGVGMLAHAQSDYVAAHAYFEESLAIRREIGDRSGIATSLNSLGNVAEIQGDYVVARAYFGESLTIRREIGDRQGIATALNNLGIVAFNQGDTVAARACFEESLKIQREIGNRPGMAGALGAFAMLIATETAAVLASAAMADASEKAAAGMRGAARLFGAAQALQTQIGTPLPPRAQEECDRYIAQARSVLGEDGFAAVWEEGRTMAWEQAVAYALKEMAD